MMMRSMIFFIVFIYGILSLVQPRSLKHSEGDVEEAGGYLLEPPNYFELLAHLKNRRNKHRIDDEDVILRPDKALPDFDQRLLPSDNSRSSHLGRPSSFYGRKSHWDTFFGKK